MADQDGRGRGLFRRQRGSSDPRRAPAPPAADPPRQTPPGLGWDAEDDVWEDEVWPDPAPRKRGARSSGEMFENARPPRTSPWDDDESGGDDRDAQDQVPAAVDPWQEPEAADAPVQPPATPAAPVYSPTPEVALSSDETAEFGADLDDDPYADDDQHGDDYADDDQNDDQNGDDWTVVQTVAEHPDSPETGPGPVAVTPASLIGSPVAPADRSTTEGPPAPARGSNLGLPSWTGYQSSSTVDGAAKSGLDAPAEPGPVSAPSEGTLFANGPTPASTNGPTAEHASAGPFSDGTYLTPEEPPFDPSAHTDDEELSLAGTAVAAEMVVPETLQSSDWDDDWDDGEPAYDGTFDDSDATRRDVEEPGDGPVVYAGDAERAATGLTPALAAVAPSDALVGTASWASLVTTSGLCLAVVAGVWQLLALASGASMRIAGGHYDVFHRIGAGISAAGPVHALTLLVATVLVSLPSFLGDRNAASFDDTAGSAMGICAASAIVATVGAVLTFRYGAHVSDLTTGELPTTQLLRLLAELVGTAGLALAAFATAMMALRTRR